MFTKLSVLEFAGDRDTTREPCPDRIIEEQPRIYLAQLFCAAGSVCQYFQTVYSERWICSMFSSLDVCLCLFAFLIFFALFASLGVAICRIWVAHLAWALSEASCVEFDNLFLRIGRQFNFAVPYEKNSRAQDWNIISHFDIIVNHQCHSPNQDTKCPWFLMSLVLLLSTGFLWHFGRGARNSPQGDRSDSQIRKTKESGTRWDCCWFRMWSDKFFMAWATNAFKDVSNF